MRRLQLGRADDPPAGPSGHDPHLPDPVAPWRSPSQPLRDFEAVLHAGRRFGGIGRLTQILRIAPRPLRDWLYRKLARNRYRLFGRADLCALPDPAFQRRLLR
jgi:predicted DCC family thiol-disulfide oxidoreductase YuxK